MTGHRTTSRLDLTSSKTTTPNRLQTVLAKADLGAAGGETLLRPFCSYDTSFRRLQHHCFFLGPFCTISLITIVRRDAWPRLAVGTLIATTAAAVVAFVLRRCGLLVTGEALSPLNTHTLMLMTP